MKIKIKNNSENLASMVAKLHARSLPNDFFPQLGEAFLEKYYRFNLNNPYGMCLIAVKDGEVVGFLDLAFNRTKYFNYFLKKNLIRVLTHILWLAIRKPSRGVEAFHIQTAKAPSLGEIGEVCFIGVDSRYQRLGIAQMLIEASDSILELRHVQTCVTKTLTENDHILRLYEKFGGEKIAMLNIPPKSYMYILWHTAKKHIN